MSQIDLPKAIEALYFSEDSLMYRLGRGYTLAQTEAEGFQRGNLFHFDYSVDGAACTAGNKSRLAAFLSLPQYLLLSFISLM